MSMDKIERNIHTYSQIKTEPGPGEHKAKLHQLIKAKIPSHKERVKTLLHRASSVAAQSKGVTAFTKKLFNNSEKA